MTSGVFNCFKLENAVNCSLKIKTPNKVVPLKTVPNVLEDEGQGEEGGLELISR